MFIKYLGSSVGGVNLDLIKYVIIITISQKGIFLAYLKYKQLHLITTMQPVVYFLYVVDCIIIVHLTDNTRGTNIQT